MDAPPVEHVHTVVVGSGFGGSVTAYRLASEGRGVVVLERGQAYPAGSFPRTPAQMGRTFWGLFAVERDGRSCAVVVTPRSRRC